MLSTKTSYIPYAPFWKGIPSKIFHVMIFMFVINTRTCQCPVNLKRFVFFHVLVLTDHYMLFHALLIFMTFRHKIMLHKNNHWTFKAVHLINCQLCKLVCKQIEYELSKYTDFRLKIYDNFHLSMQQRISLSFGVLDGYLRLQHVI